MANKKSITLNERKQIIKLFPCFDMLSQAQCEELASLLCELHYPIHEIIVTEDELVDSIYFIVSGMAEVTHKTSRHRTMISTPLAILRSSEAIGLNDTGFYSTTGKRTASVTALSSMIVLRLDVKELYHFLKKNHLESSMVAASLQMLRIRLIKQVLPFSKLSHERLQWLAKQVKEVAILTGSELFHQGDIGNKSYLLYKGKIGIYVEDVAHQERCLAILAPPTLFGETTLITRSPRNATAKAIEDSQLLMLHHDCLSELIASEHTISSMFMTLTIDRSRPLQNSKISIHQRIAADGQKIIILKNPDTNNYFKLSEEGYFIWQQLNGQHTLQDITLALAQEYQVFAPNVVVALIAKLITGGFIANYHLEEKIHLADLPLWKRCVITCRELLDARFTLGDTDKWLTKLYHGAIHCLFTPLAQLILIILIALGLTTFILHVEIILSFLRAQHINLLLLLLIIPFSVVRTLLHELGHAFAVKSYGREVHCMGIGWNIFGPVAFTDTSDMWLATRKPRIIVSLAGIYTDLLTAGLFACFIYMTTNLYLQSTLWFFALYTYIGAFNKLNPLQETDGYYALMDFLEKTNLRQSAVKWLVKQFPKIIYHPTLLKEYWPEIVYWILCIFYLIVVSILTYLVQKFALNIFKIFTLNVYISLIMPFIMVVISSLNMLIEVKQKIDE